MENEAPKHISWLRLVVGGCGVAVVFVALLMIVTARSRDENSCAWPWYGRGEHLALLPYTVVVGPVDASAGLEGLLQLGMSQAAVRAALGKPLVSAMSESEAKRLGLLYREPYTVPANELYGGVFAWVDFAGGRVEHIRFSFSAFKERFHGTQRVAIRYHGSILVLDDTVTQACLVRMLKRAWPATKIGGSGRNKFVLGTPLGFRFDPHNSTLQMISLTDWKAIRSSFRGITEPMPRRDLRGSPLYPE